MKSYLRYIIFIISFLLLALFLFIQYKIGKRRGLKKGLYRITYRAICVVVAFVLAPYLNEYILNFNLYSIGKAIHFKGLHFYRIIDFIEEIIVHNEALNDIYNFFPSLKNLLMDFPQVLFIPFTYVLTFLVLSLVLSPFYIFFSYHKKRRVLYERKSNKRAKIWAGVLTAAQSVFMISIVLTPVNGLMRVYKTSKEGLISSDSNICEQNEYLYKYQIICEIVEGYNSSVLGFIGDSPINDYIYGSLTRIHYDDNSDTSLNREMVSIARAGVVLNKTGLLNAINIEGFDDVNKLNFNNLQEKDIDIVVEAFKESLYTKDVIYEVYDWAKQYLDMLIKNYIDPDFQSDFTYEDIVGELKIILKAINYILNNPEFIENVQKLYKIVEDFINIPPIKQTYMDGQILFFDMLYAIKEDYYINFYELLMNSKIYNDLVPQIIDHLLVPYNIHTNISANPDELHQTVLYAFQVVKIFKNHKYIYEIVHLLASLSIEEYHYIGRFIKYLMNSETMNTLLYDIANWAIKYTNVELDIPTELLYKITDFDHEIELVRLVLQIVYTYMSEGYIDYDKAWYGLTNYNDTVLFKEAFRYAIKLLPKVFTMWIAGKDYKYLVGEYVA